MDSNQDNEKNNDNEKEDEKKYNNNINCLSF